MNLFSHSEPSFRHIELTNRGPLRVVRGITFYPFPKVSDNPLDNNTRIDHNMPSPFQNNQNSPQPSGFSESILPSIIRKWLSAVMPLPWLLLPVCSSRPPPFHGRNVPRHAPPCRRGQGAQYERNFLCSFPARHCVPGKPRPAGGELHFSNIRGHISYSFPNLDICQVKLMSPNDKICGSNLWLLEPILL